MKKKLKTKTSYNDSCSNEKDLLRTKINKLETALDIAEKEISSLKAKIKNILAEL